MVNTENLAKLLQTGHSVNITERYNTHSYDSLLYGKNVSIHLKKEGIITATVVIEGEHKDTIIAGLDLNPFFSAKSADYTEENMLTYVLTNLTCTSTFSSECKHIATVKNYEPKLIAQGIMFFALKILSNC